MKGMDMIKPDILLAGCFLTVSWNKSKEKMINTQSMTIDIHVYLRPGIFVWNDQGYWFYLLLPLHITIR